MPTRDEMNSCGVPFLALRRPEAVDASAARVAELEGELEIREAAIGILQSELAWAMEEHRRLIALLDEQRRAASVGGMAVSMERVEVLGVKLDDAHEKAAEPHTAAKASPAPSPQKIEIANHGATSQVSGQSTRCLCARLGYECEH